LTDGDGNAAIAAMDIDGGHRRVIYDGPGYDWGASFSPDGESIFFTSDMTDGDSELYVISTDGQVLQRLTIGGGMYASWIPPTA
jgi:Tol biopolymer transport system component